MNIKRIVILGMTSLSLFGISTTSLMQVKTLAVKAVHYKYADKYYKVKLLRKTEVDKAPHPYIKLSDVYYHWKYLPAGSIVYVKSNGSNVSWTVKGAQLPGKYWVTDYNSQDYSWFSTNLNSELPRNTYNAHGLVVRQTPNTISLTNKYGKAIIYTNTIQLYHFPHADGSTPNTAYIRVRFTNKSNIPRFPAHFISDYFNIRKINTNTLSEFDPSESTAHAPNQEVWDARQLGLSAVRPHKTVTCIIADDLHGGLHSHQRFSFQPVDIYGRHLGKAKYATGSKMHYSDDITDDDDFTDY